jgi:hypothetical protein
MNTITKPNAATVLQTRILCANLLREFAAEAIEYETNFLRPLIGKKVTKVDGSFLAKYEHFKVHLLKSEPRKVEWCGFDYWVWEGYYFEDKFGNLSISVHLTVSGGGQDQCGVNKNHCQLTNTQNLFHIEDGVLGAEKALDTAFLTERFDEMEILAQLKIVEQKKEEYNAEVVKIPYFVREYKRIHQV